MSIVAERETAKINPARSSSYYLLPVVFDSSTHVPWVMGSRSAITRQDSTPTARPERKEQFEPQFTFEPFHGVMPTKDITEKKSEFVDFAMARLRVHLAPINVPFTVSNTTPTTANSRSTTNRLLEGVSGFIGFQALCIIPLNQIWIHVTCTGLVSFGLSISEK